MMNKRGSGTELILQPTVIMIIVLGMIFSLLLYNVHTIPERSDFKKQYVAAVLQTTTEALGLLQLSENVELFMHTTWLGKKYSVTTEKAQIAVTEKLGIPATRNLILPGWLTLEPGNIPEGTSYRLAKQGTTVSIQGSEQEQQFIAPLLSCASTTPSFATLGLDAAHGYNAKTLSFQGTPGAVVGDLQEAHVTRLIAKTVFDGVAHQGLFGIELTRELKTSQYGRLFLASDPQQPQKIAERIEHLNTQEFVLSIRAGTRPNTLLAYVKHDDAQGRAAACVLLNSISTALVTQTGNSFVTGTALVPVDLSQYTIDDPGTTTLDEADGLQILKAGKSSVVLELGSLGDSLTHTEERARITGTAIAQGLKQLSRRTS